MIYLFVFLDLGQAGEATPQESRLDIISVLFHFCSFKWDGCWSSKFFQTKQLLVPICLATEFPDDERFKLFKVYRKNKITSFLAEELAYDMLHTYMSHTRPNFDSSQVLVVKPNIKSTFFGTTSDRRRCCPRRHQDVCQWSLQWHRQSCLRWNAWFTGGRFEATCGTNQSTQKSQA